MEDAIKSVRLKYLTYILEREGVNIYVRFQNKTNLSTKIEEIRFKLTG